MLVTLMTSTRTSWFSMWLDKLRRLFRLFFPDVRKGVIKLSKLTKPTISKSISGRVTAETYDSNSQKFHWYSREVESYITKASTNAEDFIGAFNNTRDYTVPFESYKNTYTIAAAQQPLYRIDKGQMYMINEDGDAIDVTAQYMTGDATKIVINIPSVSADYYASVLVNKKVFNITSSLEHCVSSNSNTTITAGTAFNTVITVATGGGYTFEGGLYGLNVNGYDKTSEYCTLSSDFSKITISIPANAVVGNITYLAKAVSIPQLDVPVIAMNADGKTLEITDVENATSYDIYVDGALKTNVAKTVQKTLTFTGANTDFLGGSETYAKIGSAPTSNNDYQYKRSQGGSYDFTGSVNVYIWGSDGANSGMYELNGTSQTNYVKVNGWNSPTKLTFTESTLICLYQAEMM